MNIESAVIFRRVARIACRILIAGLLPGGAAMAQLPISISPGNPPPVLGGSVVPFNHGATGVWGQIYSMKVAPNGNVLFMDSALSELYQLAPGASEPTLVVGPAPSSGSSNCSDLEPSGSYWNAAIAFDSANNLYVTDRYGSVVQFCRVPYNASAGTWNFSSGDIWSPPTILVNGTTTALSPQDVTFADDGSTMFVSTSGYLETPGIWKVSVNVSTGAINSVTPVITDLEDFAATIAVDHAGNLFFVENIYPTPVGQRVVGIREIPAGTTGITGDGTGAAESSQTLLVGGSSSFTGIAGITFDAQGNLYFASVSNSSYGGNVAGVFMIPNEGTPTKPNLVWADTVMVSPVYAGHQPLVDPRGFLWIATGGSSNWSPTGTLAPPCDSTSTQTIDATCLESTIVMWKPGMANLGASTVGGTTAAQITAYSVPAAGGTLILTAKNSFTEDQVVTLSAGPSDALYPLNGLSFYVVGSGLSSTQFEVSTGVLAGGSSGSTSATAKLSPIGTIYYTFNQATTPAKFTEAQPSGKSFVTIPNPTPDTSVTPAVPPCTAGTAYPAFSATETSIAQYSWCAFYVQLNTQTAGNVESDLQMLNGSNSVISGSNVYLSGVGQGAAISNLVTPATYSIASGLNKPQQVAADPWGNTYVADAALQKIERYPAGTTSPTSGTALGSGLSAPSGVAVDGAGDLFIGDSGNVYEIPFINGALATSQQTKIASGLGTGNLNLATDSMGDVFVADEADKQVVEIPNPQAALLQQGLPLQKLGTSAGFKGPSAIATDNSGNVWVADGSNLWEITMPFGGVTEITSKLQAPVTGLAVDPSGSVFVVDASGLLWIPYQVTSTSAGLNVNSTVVVASALGSSNSPPYSVALDGSENAYADYGSSSTAGLSQLGIGGAVNLSNFGEVEPNVPVEVDAQLFNLGNTPLTLAALSNDAITGANASDYTIAAATLNSPACGPATNTSPGSWCYLGLNILAPAAGQANASVAVVSNAANAPSGVNIALTTNVVQDLRPASSITASVTANTSTSGCAGSTYPGCVAIKVTVTSGTGTPQGSVILSVPGSGTSQAQQTASLNSSGVATFNFTNLSGGTYNVRAVYGGSGTAGATQNTCSSSTPACWAGSAYSTTFTINRATPSFTVGPPGTEGCLTWTATNCTPNSSNVTSYLGTDFVQVTKPVWLTASVTSTVGTPTGSVSFLVNGKPVDATQAQNALNASGIANFLMVNLPLGVYTITAQYNGDQNFASETTTLPTFEVISPSVEITATPSTVTTSPGTPVTATLNLMPLVGFSQDVSLECVSSTLPKYTECTFAYPNSGGGTVNVGGSGATISTVVVTISTNVPVNSGAIVRHEPWALAGLFGLGLLGLIAGRKRFNRYLSMICLAFMLSGVFLAVTSCTNANYSTPPAAPKVATPAGTYNVQVISYNPANLQQNSLTTPLFTLPVTVQ
jgi:hypothetical protein